MTSLTQDLARRMLALGHTSPWAREVRPESDLADTASQAFGHGTRKVYDHNGK